MSFAVFWSTSLGFLFVLQVTTLAILHRQRSYQPLTILPFVQAAVLVTGIWLAGALLTRGMLGGLPTFVDQIREGRVPPESVLYIRFIRESGVGAEQTLVEVRDPEELAAALQALAHSDMGIKSRNHPQSIYGGSLRIVIKGGGEHLIPFQVMTYEGQRFAYFYSFHRGDYDLDQNCYESTELIPFLQRCDPRFPK